MHYISSIVPLACNYISFSNFFTVNARRKEEIENNRLNCIVFTVIDNSMLVFQVQSGEEEIWGVEEVFKI